MSKIHSFTCDDKGATRVILHTPMPVGTNSVGQTWQTCWLAAGRNTTSMTVGTGLGKISSAEDANILAGSVIEISGSVLIEVVVAGATAVNTFVDNLINEELARLARELAYYGWTNG